MKIVHWPFTIILAIGSVLGTARDSRFVAQSSLTQVVTALVILDNDTITAEVAATSKERSKGLMDREEVPDGTGMLFTFEREAMRTFWMQDTLVDLDIAFLDASMTIIDIQEMESGSSQIYESSGPAKFALEVPKGWFAEHHIMIGSRAKIVFL